MFLFVITEKRSMYVHIIHTNVINKLFRRRIDTVQSVLYRLAGPNILIAFMCTHSRGIWQLCDFRTRTSSMVSNNGIWSDVKLSYSFVAMNKLQRWKVLSISIGTLSSWSVYVFSTCMAIALWATTCILRNCDSLRTVCNVTYACGIRIAIINLLVLLKF